LQRVHEVLAGHFLFPHGLRLDFFNLSPGMAHMHTRRTYCTQQSHHFFLGFALPDFCSAIATAWSRDLPSFISVLMFLLTVERERPFLSGTYRPRPIFF